MVEKARPGYHFELARLDEINPYDAIHWRSNEWPFFKCVDDKDTTSHLDGIHYAEEILHSEKRLRPIGLMPMAKSPYRLIYPEKKYHRLDGFKRYFAHKWGGKEEIYAFVLDGWYPGTQHGHPMEVLEGEWDTFLTYSRNGILIRETGRTSTV